MDGESIKWMRTLAHSLDLVLCGSLKMKENGNFYNRFIWMQPDATLKYYDKRHLFSFAGEDQQFTKGSEKVIIEYKGWKILPLICYDLRFPVWSKNRLINGKAEYDLLIYTANWPEARSVAWKSLLLARAIENQVFVAGVNRVGEDGKMIQYAGDSAIINPYGAYLSEAQNGQEDIISSELDFSLLTDFRKKFPVLKDADNFSIK
jgi:predicted amidohydrolase